MHWWRCGPCEGPVDLSLYVATAGFKALSNEVATTAHPEERAEQQQQHANATVSGSCCVYWRFVSGHSHEITTAGT